MALMATGQNLVTNGGFEAYTALPTNFAQLCLAQGWSAASGTCTLTPGCGHPDYFHLQGAAAVKPPNLIFGTTMPHTGSAMIGFAAWYMVNITNFREYPRFTLAAPMVPGQPYSVSFWTTNGVNPYSGWGTNNLGVAFTMAPLAQTCGAPITSVTPQIEITTIEYSSSWQFHSFVFTPSQAFQYICIGNFHNDAGTIAAQMSPTGGMGAYYFLDDVVVQLNAPLPIELLSFDAWPGEHRTAELAWTTATERDNARFEVERSTDGMTFTRVGDLPGAGSSGEQHDYAFTDMDPFDGLNYYRIRQVDVDGASNTTEVRAVVIDISSTRLLIWPVPAADVVHVHFEGSTDPALTTISITDMVGRLIDERIPQTGTIQFTGLPSGSYVVTVTTGSRVQAQGRFVVQDR